MSFLDIKVQINSLDGLPHPEEMNRVSAFLMAGVEAGVKQTMQDVESFDPQTGEPVYWSRFVDPTAVDLIGAMGVISPYAMAGVLQGNFSGTDPDQIVVEPIVMETPDDD